MSARNRSRPGLETLEAKVALSHVHAVREAVARPDASFARPTGEVRTVGTDTPGTPGGSGVTTETGRGTLRPLGLSKVYEETALVTDPTGATITQVSGVNIVSRFGTTVLRGTSYPASFEGPEKIDDTIVSVPGVGRSGTFEIGGDGHHDFLRFV